MKGAIFSSQGLFLTLYKRVYKFVQSSYWTIYCIPPAGAWEICCVVSTVKSLNNIISRVGDNYVLSPDHIFLTGLWT